MSASTDRIREALKFIDASDRETWLRMGMAIKSELGDTGFDVWEEWSLQAESFNLKDARDVWKSIRAGGKVTIGTLFYVAKANGWRDDGRHQLPPPDEVAEQRRIATERAAKEQAEIARERAETAKKAVAILQAAAEVKADHPYLSRKQVSPVATLREIDANAAAMILGYAPKSGGEQLTGRLLVVPVKQGDELSTLELIDGDKRKAALAGRGSKVAGYWATECLPDGDGAGLTLLIGEGVATALSGKEASGYTAIATLSAGNLSAVAKAMRERYRKATLVILADLVKATGTPDTHAIEATQSAGGRLAIPDFGTGRPEGATDFNDLAQLSGSESVRACINASKPCESVAGRSVIAAENWPDPQPLSVRVPPEPYPIDALPSTIRAAVEEVARFVQAPLPMIASSALAAMSVAIQAHADAKRADKLHGPVGIFLLTIADSGERKSTCDGFFSGAIRDYEAAQADAAKPILKDYISAIDSWESKRNGVKDKLRQLAKEGKPTANMESALRNLEHDKPEPPRVPRLLYADATPEALAYSLAKQWPSGGVVSAEAGIVFGSHGMGKDSVMRNLAMLNQLWDGTSLTIDRRSSESFTVRGARLTVALQVQEPTLREFFTKSGTLARGTGFLARFLVAWPASTQGSRPFTEAPPNWPSLAMFNRRIAAILDQPVPLDDDGVLTPPMLSLTPEAKAAWVVFHDAIESELSSGGELYDVRDVASKSADNAVRLAGLFQIFEGAAGAIGAVAFESGSRIAAWHLHEARRFFGELALPEELANAVKLDRWLIEYCRRERTHLVGKNHVRQYGPLRDGETLDAAIRELACLSRVQLVKDERMLTIRVNPVLVLERGAW
jgi:putative DNA primase/helicase